MFNHFCLCFVLMLTAISLARFSHQGRVTCLLIPMGFFHQRRLVCSNCSVFKSSKTLDEELCSCLYQLIVLDFRLTSVNFAVWTPGLYCLRKAVVDSISGAKLYLSTHFCCWIFCIQVCFPRNCYVFNWSHKYSLFLFLSEISTNQSCASAVNLVRLSSITGGYFWRGGLWSNLDVHSKTAGYYTLCTAVGRNLEVALQFLITFTFSISDSSSCKP